MDLLGDSQEVIRNEALLLMVGLTHASPDINRFAAYQGAFENQINIIRQDAQSCIFTLACPAKDCSDKHRELSLKQLALQPAHHDRCG